MSKKNNNTDTKIQPPYSLTAIRDRLDLENHPELLLSYTLLEDSVRLYQLVQHRLRETPLTDERGYPNKLLKTREGLIVQINKAIKELVTTIPYTALKSNTNTQDTELSADDFVKMMTE